MTYRRLDHLVETSAATIAARLGSFGEVVALDGEGDSLLIAFLAVARAGGIAAPLSAAWTPEERVRALKSLRPKLVLNSSDVGDVTMLPPPLPFPSPEHRFY